MSALRIRRLLARFGLFAGIATCYVPPFVPFTLLHSMTPGPADAIAEHAKNVTAFGWFALEATPLLEIQLALLVIVLCFDASTPNRSERAAPDAAPRGVKKTWLEMLYSAAFDMAVVALLTPEAMQILTVEGFSGAHVEIGGFFASLNDLGASFVLIGLAFMPRFLELNRLSALAGAAVSAIVAANAAHEILIGKIADVRSENISDAGVSGGVSLASYGLLFAFVAGLLLATWYFVTAISTRAGSALGPRG